ncbi:MAG: hypothetical protein HGB36_12200 [Chlorobiaceae bacterium]|nr:hypothetical protein [Chlorobiaceae bacterium]
MENSDAERSETWARREYGSEGREDGYFFDESLPDFLNRTGKAAEKTGTVI